MSISAAILSASIAVATAAETPATVAQFHFIGMQNLSANTNAAKLNQIWKMPETAQVRGMISQKLASASEQILSQTLKGKGSNLQPLFEDLFGSESIVQVLESTNHQAQLNIAAQLDENRSAFWASNLLTATSAKATNTKNWSTKLSSETSLTFTREGKWTCVTVGKDGEKKFLSELSTDAFSLKKTNWLEAEIDWAKVEKSFGFSIPFKLSHSKVSIYGKADNLFTAVESKCSEKINWTRETWKIPTVIREPLVSFTAAQPVAPICKSSRLFEQIGFNPLARQFFCWAQPEIPLQTFGAFPVKDATNDLRTLSSKLLPAINPLLKQRHSGGLMWDEKQTSVVWTNVMLMQPYLKPLPDVSNQYIIAGLFPRVPAKTPVPTELFKLITDDAQLVYCDWEITANRLGHWDLLTKVLPFFSPETITNSTQQLRISRTAQLPAHRWLRAIGPLLGDTVTKVTVTNPEEVTLRRKSNIGFNGMELMYFAGLVDDPKFPFMSERSISKQAAPK